MLTEQFAAAGWGMQTHVVMTHRGAPDRMAPLQAVREVGHEDLRRAEMAYMRTQPWCASDEPARQVLEHHLRIGTVLGERCFAVHDGGDVIAYAKLRHRGAIAQVEDVVVVEGHRGAGLGRIVTSAALQAGLDLEPELMFHRRRRRRLAEAALRAPRLQGCRAHADVPPPACAVVADGRYAPYGSVRRPPAKSRASRR